MARELVGDAYVRIFADTKYMSKAIQDDLRKAGKGSAESFLADFDKTLRQSAKARLQRSQIALADAITGGDFDAMLKRSGQSVDTFVTGIQADLRRLDSRKSVNFAGLQDALDSLDQWAGTARLREEADRLAVSLDADWLAASKLNNEFERQAKVGGDLAKMYDRLDTNALQFDIRRLTREMDTQNKAFDDLHAAALRMNADWDKTVRKAAESNVSVHRTSRAIHALNADLDKFSIGGGVGRLFGKGSRNDFVNFLGSAVGGMVSLGESIVKLPVKALQLFGDVSEDLVGHFKTLSASGASVRTIIGQGIAAGARAAIPALIALVVAAGSLATILPVAVSAVSAALGGVTAIVGALAVAITGALLPAVPLVLALAAGIAPLVLGFMALRDEADNNKKAFDGLKRGYQSLLADLKPFFRDLREEANLFGDTVAGFGPFLSDMGDQVIDVIRNFRTLFSLPETKKFRDEFATTLPIIFGNLGRGLGNLAAALTAFFAPILPYAERISAAFETMTQDFLDWAASADGQNSIADFMARAYEVAKDLGQILVNVGVAIAKTFDIGTEEAGGGFLQYLVDLTAEWRKWVDSPEGKETLREWFDNAREAGEKLFGIIGEVFEFFGKLDTEKAREDLQSFLGSLESMAESLETVAGAISTTEQVFSDFGDFFGGFASANGDDFTYIIGLMNDFGTAVNDFLAPAVESIGGIFGQIGEDLSTSFSDIQTTISDFYTWLTTPPDFSSITGYLTAPFALAGLDIVAHLLYFQTQVQTFLASLPVRIQEWLAGVPAAMMFPIQTGIGFVIAELTTFPGRVGGLLGQVPGAARAALEAVIETLPEPFRTGAQRILSALDTGISDIRGRLGGWASQVGGVVSGVVSALTSPFEEALRQINGILSQIASAAGNIPGLGAVGQLFNNNAAGGILYGATVIRPGEIAGEAGREAIVPLDRPLSMIDPSVRALAAFAQGKSFSNAQVTGNGGITVMPGAIAVTVPNADPVAASEAMLDRLVSVL